MFGLKRFVLRAGIRWLSLQFLFAFSSQLNFSFSQCEFEPKPCQQLTSSLAQAPTDDIMTSKAFGAAGRLGLEVQVRRTLVIWSTLENGPILQHTTAINVHPRGCCNMQFYTA